MNAPTDLERARFNMIEQQIRPWDVLDLQILDLLSHVRREDFVPLAHKALAFVDMQVPLPGGSRMLEPKVEARMLQDLKLMAHEKVLEVGTGSGYMAALLSHRAQRVISLEIKPELAKFARENLQRAGITNVDVREADGSNGLASESPFDAIVLSGSVAEVPASILSQLKVGGRLAAITGCEPIMRFTLITRTGETTYTTAQPWDNNAPRLANFPEPSKFTF
ncbi:MAG TPA: protein-L-isoaspartate O-methyltransferase [Ramlibacter sp.]|jgi:protein-L-isoaspartate(D-aspartate) O-methyltransferase|nr:protein-L-isoaspartate O-methyltransferase [Ramlibacter sp.]